MKKSDFYKILGILYVEGHKNLVQVLARSPLSNVPEPERRELTYDEYETKKRNEKTRYHNMSPAEKRKKVEITRKRRAKEDKLTKERQALYASFF